ncbi:MAG: CRP/FNR family transcriptional regulator, anaerobic regulatory protein [Phormidesmis priestleyi Ana]|uniref:CRP/FNR family transcriptional regulator, anaerobic regulatory protein n=1 Tax=Phormidesmis priestleyi Ana TaxID=1666911 RepID=A0A0P8DES8_9CYAN|nr:MAG: CRP/FNR family transcriptional regulator, anaerobic regulatory protein [Phormidesmis priestleyi Ana]
MSALEFDHWLELTPLFQGASSENIAYVAQIVQLKHYQKGEIVFTQDSEATGFFVIKTGRVKIFKLAAQGKEQILHIFSEQEYFAEVPALDGKRYPASAEALEDSTLLFFPRFEFLDLLQRYPALTIRLLLNLSMHLRHLTGLVEELSFKDVPQRLAAHLINLSQTQNQSNIITLEVTKSQLAALLGTIPATISRAFYRLSQDGLIMMQGAQIELLDRDRLHKLGQALAVDE